MQNYSSTLFIQPTKSGVYVHMYHRDMLIEKQLSAHTVCDLLSTSLQNRTTKSESCIIEKGMRYRSLKMLTNGQYPGGHD